MAKGRESGMPDEEYWATFFNPECVLTSLDCAGLEGDVVEFGCGYGTFTVEAARRTRGTVVALDIDAEMVERTAHRATAAGRANVAVEQRDFTADGCGRADGSADYALLFNILHIEGPTELLSEALRVLKPGGKAGIIHWNYDRSTPRGPSMEIRPRPEQCRTWAEDAGFEFHRFETLACCPYHYGLVLRRPA